MKFKFLILLLALPATLSMATPKCPKQLRIAIVDTGLDLNDPRFTDHLCENGHRNFVNNESMDDKVGHGTFVAGLIEKYAGNSNYCILVYKFYQDSADGNVNLSRESAALRAAIDNGANIINFSGGGPIFNEPEAVIIRDNPQITFVVAAGNEGKNLDIHGNEFYPASLFYKNIEVVGSVTKNGDRASTSNYSSKINNKEVGQNAISYIPNGIGLMSGTSMATAIFSGKLVAKKSKLCNIDSGDGNGR